MTIKEEFELFRVKHNNVPPAKGLSLVSVPLLKDAYFKKTIVYLTEHNDDGSVGFILNKQLDFHLNQLLEGIPESEIPVYYGGPVANDSIHFLHTLGNEIPNTKHVRDNIFWGGDFYHVKEVLLKDIAKSEHIKFFVGYSGWDPYQLDKEINQDTWLVTKIKTEQMFPVPESWENILTQMGFKYELWSHFPEDALLN